MFAGKICCESIMWQSDVHEKMGPEKKNEKFDNQSSNYQCSDYQSSNLKTSDNLSWCDALTVFN